MNLSLMHPADQIVLMMNRIYACSLTTTSGGNLSIRDENGDIWITPASIDKGSLTREDIMQVKPDGTTIGRHRPSVELRVHKNIYDLRPDINAIVHAHPAGMVAFSMVRRAPDTRLLPSVRQLCGEVGRVGYSFPGSPRLQEELAQRYSEGYSTVIMDNHGVICGAESLHRAFMMFETTVNFGKLELAARKLGAPRILSDDQLQPRPLPALGVLPAEAMTNAERAGRRDLCAMIRRACDQCLFTSAQGDFSMRLPDGSLLISPHMQDPKYIEPADLVRVKNGCCEAGKLPSASVLLHQRIYQLHPELNFIIIAQSPAAMAFAVTGAELDTYLVPETYVTLRNIARLPFGQDIETIAAVISQKTPVVILENQCAILADANMVNAFDHLEVLEFTAEAVIAARELGEIVLITKDEMQELIDAFGL